MRKEYDTNCRKRILDYVDFIQGPFTPAQIKFACNVIVSNVHYHLRKLKEKGYIKQIGKEKNTCIYILNKYYTESTKENIELVNKALLKEKEIKIMQRDKRLTELKSQEETRLNQIEQELLYHLYKDRYIKKNTPLRRNGREIVDAEMITPELSDFRDYLSSISYNEICNIITRVVKYVYDKECEFCSRFDFDISKRNKYETYRNADLKKKIRKYWDMTNKTRAEMLETIRQWGYEEDFNNLKNEDLMIIRQKMIQLKNQLVPSKIRTKSLSKYVKKERIKVYMSERKRLREICEQMYVDLGISYKECSKRLNVNVRTVSGWIQKGGWVKKKSEKQFYKQ